jgi:hypothetical protein
MISSAGSQAGSAAGFLRQQLVAGLLLLRFCSVGDNFISFPKAGKFFFIA